MTMKWRHQEDQKEHERLSEKTALSFVGRESRTIQSERDNCDLNVLVRRFGVAPLGQPIDASTYGSVDRDLTLQSAFALLERADRDFRRLPAALRERFNNDPHQLLAALEDPSLRDELVELGVIERRGEVRPPIAEEGPAPAAPIVTES